MADRIEPFVIAADGAALDDLRDRLRRTRWPEREPVGDWSQGVPLAYVQDLCRYWADEYDWRATEARLNDLPQFRGVIDGLGIPVVLFMENYDINRCGYHDTHDTMANIDLDYGAALAAITIETVARAAINKPPV